MACARCASNPAAIATPLNIFDLDADVRSISGNRRWKFPPPLSKASKSPPACATSAIAAVCRISPIAAPTPASNWAGSSSVADWTANALWQVSRFRAPGPDGLGVRRDRFPRPGRHRRMAAEPAAGVAHFTGHLRQPLAAGDLQQPAPCGGHRAGRPLVVARHIDGLTRVIEGKWLFCQKPHLHWARVRFYAKVDLPLFGPSSPLPIRLSLESCLRGRCIEPCLRGVACAKLSA